MLEPFSSFKRRVTISATNVNEGIFTEFDQTNITFDQVGDAAVASASIPGVFPPFHWEDGRIFMDGMAVYNLNIEAAVRQCMDVVDDESKIIMDVLLCGSNAAPEEETDSGHSINNYLRGRQLHNYYDSVNSLTQSLRAHPTVQHRYVFKQENAAGGLQ